LHNLKALKNLYLNHNLISYIEGVDNLVCLRDLFLIDNLITNKDYKKEGCDIRL